MQTLFQDIRYSLRMLAKRPGFTAVAVITLALGIGANTAIFSLVNTVLLRPFPVAHPDELYSLSVTGKNDAMLAFSYPEYVDFRDRNDVLAGLFAARISPMSLSRGGNNERLWGYLVSGNYFEVLGVSAVQGRTFTADDDRARLASPVAVLSYGCWTRRFGADTGIVGQDVLINGHSFKIIGVTPEGFTGTEMIYTPEIWVPMMMQEWIEPGNGWLDRRRSGVIFATGRLAPNVLAQQAEASLNVLAAQLGKEYPDTDEGQTIQLMPPGFILPAIRGAFVSFTAILMATVGLVLLIACANLAGLLLARATERRREIAIRLAIGASRIRLVRQLLTESAVLALMGGALGLLLAVWIIDLVVAFKPPLDVPITIELGLDWRVLVFSLFVSLITGIVFGLVPALQATKPDLVPALRDSSSQTGARRSRLRSSLVVAQIALSLVLLIAAGLVLRALGRVQTMNPGFTVENGLVMSFDIGLQGYDQTRGQEFYRQVIERVERVPGVRSASLADLFPLSLNYSSNGVYIEEQAPVRGSDVPQAMVASVGLKYFTTMGIPILAGRDFSESDTDKSPRVVVVNEAFAHHFFSQAGSLEEVIGKRLSFRSSEGPFIQIAGIARDGKYWSIGEKPTPFIYSPLNQSYSPNATMLVRTTGDPKALAAAIRGTIAELDATLPVFDVKTFAEHLSFSLFPARVAATLLVSFGGLALLLAAVGTYGVAAYSVSQRTREIGIRMALGAARGDILKLMLSHGLKLASIGLVIGLAVAFSLTRLMETVLYGVSATDAVTFVSISVLLEGVVLAASFIPARRALAVDPMVALRYE
ncbi:MAG TPA: ABC transporter permease [Blastocatellia bacterium]|nr:ABC transporter permease [Blastocatellia bacterium]